MKSKFRVLSNWNIEFCEDADYKAQCCKNAEKKTAVIYTWKLIHEEPKDYILHELLHIAFSEVLYSFEHDEYEIAREKEECLVQDICKLKVDYEFTKMEL